MALLLRAETCDGNNACDTDLNIYLISVQFRDAKRLITFKIKVCLYTVCVCVCVCVCVYVCIYIYIYVYVCLFKKTLFNITCI